MIKYQIQEYMYGFPTHLIQGQGGARQFNIHLTEDTPNMALVGRGDWEALDLYTQAVAPTFAGIIREQAANGNWYIEVTEDTEALLVYDAPIIAEDYNKEFAKESHFVNEQGKTVRQYQLKKYDIFEVSALGFEGTPAKNATVSFANGKYVVA